MRRLVYSVWDFVKDLEPIIYLISLMFLIMAGLLFFYEYNDIIGKGSVSGWSITTVNICFVVCSFYWGIKLIKLGFVKTKWVGFRSKLKKLAKLVEQQEEKIASKHGG